MARGVTLRSRHHLVGKLHCALEFDQTLTEASEEFTLVTLTSLAAARLKVASTTSSSSVNFLRQLVADAFGFYQK